MIWDWSFVQSILPALLDGVRVTLLETLCGVVIATVGGFVILLARRAPVPPLRWLAIGFVYVFRGTPLLIQLYFAFFLLPLVGVRMSAFVAGALTLGLNYAAYFSETYRAGIQSVPKGQWEAARALSFGPRRTWLAVVVPQALRSALPALGNHVNLMFKMSALLAAIGVLDVFGSALNIGTKFYRYLEPVTIAGVFYLVISVPVSILISRIELRQRASRGA